MVMKKIFIVVFSCCCTLLPRAQTQRIALLKAKLSAAVGNDEKLSVLLELCNEHENINRDSLYSYATEAVQLASGQKKEATKSRAAIFMIYAYLRKNETDSALGLIEATLPKNPVTDINTRSIYFELAAQKVDGYGDASNYKEAIDQAYKIVNEAEQYKESVVLSKNINKLGVVNYILNNVEEALSWQLKGLSYTQESPRFDACRAAHYINLADIYWWTDKLDSATYFVDKAIALCERSE